MPVGSSKHDLFPMEAEHPRIGEVMGAGGLLRAWRDAASTRLGRPILQRDVAKAAGRSLRWVRDLETGAVGRTLTREECDGIAELLGLDSAQRHALLLANIGGAFCQVETTSSPRISPELRLLIDRQMPSPAFVVDAAWTVLAYNQAALECFPWIAQPDASVMRWLLLDGDARDQHLDWEHHATVYLQLLRGAAVARPHDAQLRRLVSDVSSDPALCCLWADPSGRLAEHRDGDVIRMALPAKGGDITEFVTHVLYPASMPDFRMIVLTWQVSAEDDSGA